MGHVDDTLPAPPQFVDGHPNPAYLTWYEPDQYVLSWINFTLSESVLPNVINKVTAADAWSALVRIYASGSKLQIRHLTKELQNIRRGDAAIHDYLQAAKSKADQLAALGAPLKNDDFIAWLLDGLGEDYRPFVRHIESRMEPISFEDLHSLLLSEESQIRRYSVRHDSPAPTTFYSSAANPRGHRSGRGRGRGAPRGRFISNPLLSSGRSDPNAGILGSRPIPTQVVCHNCGGRGHIKPNYPSPPIPPISQPAIHPATGPPTPYGPVGSTYSSPHTMFANSSAQMLHSQQWLMDSGTNHHLTSDLDNLANHSEYNGIDHVMFGNGKSLPISHYGSSPASLSHTSIALDNILHVRNAPYNLLSISALTRNDPISIEFFDSLFVIKDWRTSNEIYRGYAVDGPYSLPLNIVRHLLPFACIATLDVWHRRLGHAHDRVVKQALRQHHITFLPSQLSLCHGCAAIRTCLQ
ncbi:unnamed protein product [Linum trigynum]|uniref:GAG-pre-integrase domain-containing protein n=1 Tax=Linum trigynum TaxID=586398 RepID=A0AAV2GI72_9ROSI